MQPGVVTICITSYPPFMMYKDETACPSPCPYDQLKNALPTTGNAAGQALLNASSSVVPNSLAGRGTPLTGFDKDFADLVLTRMLGFDVTYLSYGSFTTMYLALLAGECDLAITASQMCAHAHACSTLSCAGGAISVAVGSGDTGAGGALSLSADARGARAGTRRWRRACRA